MKKMLVLLLFLVLLAVPVSAFGNLVCDDSGLLTDTDVQRLEDIYSTFPNNSMLTCLIKITFRIKTILYMNTFDSVPQNIQRIYGIPSAI